MMTHVEHKTTTVKVELKLQYLCNYSDPYIHVKGTITISNTGTTAAQGNRNKKVTFKNCAPFIDCISEINNT